MAANNGSGSGTVWGLNAIAVVAIIVAVLGFFGGAEIDLFIACFFAALGARALAKIIEILINIDQNIANIQNNIFSFPYRCLQRD